MDYELTPGPNGHSSDTSFTPKPEAKLQGDDMATLQSTEILGGRDVLQGLK